MSSLPAVVRLSRDSVCTAARSLKPLVHVHRVQQRLVEAGLVLLRDDQEVPIGPAERLGQLGLPDPVHPRLGVLLARHVGIGHGAGEGHEDAQVVALLGDVAVERLAVANGVETARRHHHRLRPAADAPPDVLSEVLHHHLGLLARLWGWSDTNRAMALEALARSSSGSSLDPLLQAVVRLVGRVAPAARRG